MPCLSSKHLSSLLPRGPQPLVPWHSPTLSSKRKDSLFCRFDTSLSLASICRVFTPTPHEFPNTNPISRYSDSWLHRFNSFVLLSLPEHHLMGLLTLFASKLLPKYLLQRQVTSSGQPHADAARHDSQKTPASTTLHRISTKNTLEADHAHSRFH